VLHHLLLVIRAYSAKLGRICQGLTLNANFQSPISSCKSSIAYLASPANYASMSLKSAILPKRHLQLVAEIPHFMPKKIALVAKAMQKNGRL